MMSDESMVPSGGAGPRDPRRALSPEPAPGWHGLRFRGTPHRTDQRQELTAQTVLNALRESWKVALPIGLLLAIGAGALVYTLFEPMYLASAWIQIHEEAPSLVFPAANDRTKVYVQTQIELLRSPMVLGPVVSKPEIARIPEIQEQKDPLEWLADEIRIASVGGSELFRVSYRSPVSENAATVVNAVVDEYFGLRDYNSAQQVQRVIELLEQEKGRRADEVGRLRENVRELTKRATGKDPFAAPEPEPLVLHPLAQLQGTLVTAEVEREVLEAQVEAFKDTVLESVPEIPERQIETVVERDPEVQRLKTQIAARRSKLHDIETKTNEGASGPTYEHLSKQLAADEAVLEDLRVELREQARAEMEAVLIAARKDELGRMEAMLESRRAMEAALRARFEDELVDVEKGSGETLELEFKRTELAQAQQVLDLISTRLLQIRVEQQAPAQVALRSRATPPQNPVQLIPYRNMSIASLAALCLPFVLAVFYERLVRRVSDAESLEQGAGLLVVGETPRLPAQIRGSRGSVSKRLGQQIDVFEESVDSLRTSLVLSDDLGHMRVLAVTSAGSHEGKSSVAAQLAVSIAQASGQPTLLIDCDMRSPSIHKIFDTRLEPGLADLLNGELPVEDAIVTDWGNSVHFLPAGKLRTSPHRLVGNGAWKSILDKIPTIYRYVILDTPPVLAASEALVFAKGADVTLMCAMRNVSRLGRVRKGYERLVAAGSRPVGIVLNGIPLKRYERRYGSSSYVRVQNR